LAGARNLRHIAGGLSAYSLGGAVGYRVFLDA
jgi:hypothetical protein